MQTIHQLKAIPDDELLSRLAALLAESRHTEADLVACIGEVDARRLYAREATPSMFGYCLERPISPSTKPTSGSRPHGRPASTL